MVLSGAHFEYDPSLIETKDSFLQSILQELLSNERIRRGLNREILRKLKVVSSQLWSNFFWRLIIIYCFDKKSQNYNQDLDSKYTFSVSMKEILD